MNILSNVIYCCDQSCIFSIITPVFSVTWSSEIIQICWFAVQEVFLIIKFLKTVLLLHNFVETVLHCIFRIVLFKWHLFEIEILRNIINVPTFDKLNAPFAIFPIFSKNYWISIIIHFWCHFCRMKISSSFDGNGWVNTKSVLFGWIISL